MTKQELKTKLLKTKLFINNKYLDKYLDLIINYKTSKKYVERHHILQRAYFKFYKLPVDNSNSNIVKLSYADHCKAHWLLYWCTKSLLKNANAWTIQFLQTSYKKYTGKDKRKLEFCQKDFELLDYYWEQIRADNNNLFRTAKDLEILQAKYSIIGADGVQKLLSFKRGIQSIREQASFLNLPAPIYWTDKEINKLKKLYPIEGYFCFKKFKNKTKAAVQAKANRLCLCSRFKWSEQEIKLLTKYFPLYGYKCKKFIKNKAIRTIQLKARELKLFNPLDKKWKAKDIKILKQYYSSIGVACSAMLSKQYTNNSIPTKARLLGLSYIGYWTEKNINIILKNYPNYTKIKELLPETNMDNIYSKVKELKKKGVL